jgi:hypothetical protein
MELRARQMSRLRIWSILVVLSCAGQSSDVRAAMLAEYDFTGTVTTLANRAGVLPANVNVGSPFDLQVIIDTSFPGTSGDSVSLENYGQTNSNGPFPVQSVSVELNGNAPLQILGVPQQTEQGPVNHVTIEHNEALSGNSFVDELVIGMTGLQLNGNPGEFSVVAIDQTFFGTTPGFTTSVQLGAPLGPTPSNAINSQEGNMPLSFSVCGDPACSTMDGFSGSLNQITVAPVPLPASLWLLLSGLGSLGGGLRIAELRKRSIRR